MQAARDDLYTPQGQTRVTDVDALVRLAEVGLDGLDPATAAGRPASDRYQIHLHHHPHRGRARSAHLGSRLPDAAAQLIACDATLRVWLHGEDGTVVQSKRARVVSMPLRLRVEHRDGGCVVPGCATTRHLHIHHLTPWSEGGPTESSNLVALCRRHHRDLHHDHYTHRPATPTPAPSPSSPRNGRDPPNPTPDHPANHHPSPERADCHRSGERARWKWLDWNTPRRE